MRRSTSTVRRVCAVGTTAALIGLTTGLGLVTATAAYADDTLPPTSESAVVAGTDTGAGTPSEDGSTAGRTPAADTDSTPGTTPASGGDGPADGDPAATTPPTDDTDTEQGAGTDAEQGTGTGTDATGTDGTGQQAGQQGANTSGVSAAEPDASIQAADVEQTVRITGTAAVGQQLSLTTTGFGASKTTVWTDSTGKHLSDDVSYTVTTAEVGKTITATVTGATPDETAKATTGVIAPVFVDADGNVIADGTDAETVLDLETDVVTPFSYTFRAAGDPELSLAWFGEANAGDEDSDEMGKLSSGLQSDGSEEWTPEDQLPEGIDFDPESGILSGSTEQAGDFTFAVTATVGSGASAVSVTQDVDLSIAPAAPAGVLAWTTDRATFGSDRATGWIIEADGTVTTETTDVVEGPDGEYIDLGSSTPGGRPTIAQGGTLMVSGTLVDRFGNPVWDEDGDDPQPTVTSSVASDVIAPDEEFGDFGLVNVTFPHASIHRLTVAVDTFATAFDVDVVPTAVPAATPSAGPVAAPVEPTATTVRHTASGRLAYTGSDSTDALPWALGALAAGALLIGLRTLRRRAQR